MIRSFSRDGIEQAYVSEGREQGIPLVLLHGFTGHRDDFRGVTNALAEGRQVFIPDLRGHGASAHAGDPAAYHFSACVEDVVALLDTLQVERCDLLGHSMGGMIALRVALEHEQRLRSLVLMSTAPTPLGPDASSALLRGVGFLDTNDLATMQAAMEKVGRADPDPVIAKWADRYWPHQRRRYAEMDEAAYVGFAHAMIESNSLVDHLSEIGCPTLVLIGSEDPDFLPGADLLEAGIPGAVRVTLHGAGHHPHEEEREVFLSAMRRHFQTIGA